MDYGHKKCLVWIPAKSQEWSAQPVSASLWSRSPDEFRGTFPRSKSPVNLFSRGLEVTAALSSGAAKSQRQNQQFKSKEGLPEQRLEVDNKVLVAKEKALEAMKTEVFQPKWNGPSHVVATSHPRYELVTTDAKVFRKPIHAQRLRKYFCRSSHIFYKPSAKPLW